MGAAARRESGLARMLEHYTLQPPLDFYHQRRERRSVRALAAAETAPEINVPLIS
jgi:hypothetical protein